MPSMPALTIEKSPLRDLSSLEIVAVAGGTVQTTPTLTPTATVTLTTDTVTVTIQPTLTTGSYDLDTNCGGS